MRTLDERYTHATARLVLALVLCVAASTANAQKPGKAAQQRAAAGAGIVWRDCATATPDQAPAIEAARHQLAQAWLESRGTFFAAYTMPGEKRSPFDLSPREPNTGPREGYVEARPPRCTFSIADAGDRSYRVRFAAPFYRFHEDGQGWSAPLRNGLMLDATVTGADAGWKADAPPSEDTILMPDQKPRSATATRLPADAAWAAPIPGCTRRQQWNGHDCVARKR